MQCLKSGGEFWLKTDFFDYGKISTDLFSHPGWEEIASTPNLHQVGEKLAVEAPEGANFWAADIRTNYERKHIEKGSDIFVGGWRRTS